MKRLAYIFAGTVIFLAAGCKTGENKNADTVCYVYEHSYEFGLPEQKGHLKEIIYYKDSLPVKRQYINKNKRKRDFKYYRYNEEGRLLREDRYSRRNMLLTASKYHYDNLERLYLLQEYNNNGQLIGKTEWVYKDESVQWVSRSEYNRSGLIERVEITKTNEDGQRSEGIIYGRGKKKMATFKIEERDSSGNELLKVFFKPDGQLLSRIQKKFDRNNRLIFEHYEGKYKKKIEYKNERLAREIFLDLRTGEKKQLIRYVYISE